MENYKGSEAVDGAEETGRHEHHAARQEKFTAQESAALAGIRGAIDTPSSEQEVLERFTKLVGYVLMPDIVRSQHEHVQEDLLGGGQYSGRVVDHVDPKRRTECCVIDEIEPARGDVG